jgi:hypothetical protein
MNPNEKTLLEAADSDVGERLISRRDAIREGATSSSVIVAGLAMESVRSTRNASGRGASFLLS